MKKILLVILSLLILTGCEVKNNETNQKGDKSTSEVTDKIDVVVNNNTFMKIEYAFTPNKDLLLNVWNLNNETLKYASIDIAMFDKDNKLIKVQKEYVRYLNVTNENLYRIFLNEDKNIKRIEISSNIIDVKTFVEEYYTDKVSGTVENVGNGKLVATIKNNAGFTMDGVSASIVVYKDDKVKDGITFNINNLRDTATQEMYLNATNDKGKITYMDYDEAKVIINYAYKNK